MKKRKKKIIKYILGVILGIIILPFFMTWSLNRFFTIQEAVHYMNMNNFKTKEIKVQDIDYYGNDRIIFELPGLDEDELPSEYCFQITGKSVDILIGNGIRKKVSEGTIIECTYAQIYLGGGYPRPIVGVSVEGEELLSFKQGYTYLMLDYVRRIIICDYT